MKTKTHTFFNALDGREIILYMHMSLGRIEHSLVLHERGKPATLLGYVEDELVIRQDAFSARETIDHIQTSLNNALPEFRAMYELSDLYESHQSIHTVVVSLDPEFCSVEIIPTVKIFDQEHVITDFDQDADLKDDEYIIHREIRNVSVNGYNLEPRDALGKRAKNLQYTEEVHGLDMKTKEDIEHALTSVLVEREIIFTSTLAEQTQLITELPETPHEWALVRFGEEDSYVYVRGSSATFQKLQYGKRELVLQLQRAGIGYNRLSTMTELTLARKGDLEENAAEQIAYTLDVEGSVLSQSLLDSDMGNGISKQVKNDTLVGVKTYVSSDDDVTELWLEDTVLGKRINIPEEHMQEILLSNNHIHSPTTLTVASVLWREKHESRMLSI